MSVAEQMTTELQRLADGQRIREKSHSHIETYSGCLKTRLAPSLLSRPS